MCKSKKNCHHATNLLDCSSSTGCAPPTLCTSIRPVRERERGGRSKKKEWKEGGIHNSSLQNSGVWHKLTCHSCRSSEGSGLQLPPLGHQNFPVVSQCQQQLLQSCLRRRGVEEEGQGRRETIGRRWRLNCVPVMCTKKLGFDQTWMASLQICTAN